MDGNVSSSKTSSREDHLTKEPKQEQTKLKALKSIAASTKDDPKTEKNSPSDESDNETADSCDQKKSQSSISKSQTESSYVVGLHNNSSSITLTQTVNTIKHAKLSMQMFLIIYFQIIKRSNRWEAVLYQKMLLLVRHTISLKLLQ